MKRSEFIALMLSPLLIPFIKKREPVYKHFDEHLMVFPNGSKVYHYTDNYHFNDGYDNRLRFTYSKGIHDQDTPSYLDYQHLLKQNDDGMFYKMRDR